MAQVDVIRAWKDPKYRRSLTDAQRRTLPTSPAGLVKLSDEQMKVAGGINTTLFQTTWWTCTMPSVFFFCGCG